MWLPLMSMHVPPFVHGDDSHGLIGSGSAGQAPSPAAHWSSVPVVFVQGAPLPDLTTVTEKDFVHACEHADH